MQQKTIFFAYGAVLLLGIFHYLLLSPPGNFPEGGVINIEKGSSLRKVSSLLLARDVIRSRAAFEFFVIALGGEKRIQPAFYTFEEKLPVFAVAWRIGGGKFFTAPVVVTIPEGFNMTEIAEVFDAKLLNFDREAFQREAKDKEGYLFPDTYFFLNADGAAEAIESMTKNFEKKIGPLRAEMSASGRTEREIIIMASIIEGEANGDEDRALISGILWKRIGLGMPLQADAAPITYKEKGLPQGPIGNPGMKAILAALRPESSPYLYYLHDKDGNIHYAKNFAEHTANKKTYLK